MRPVNLIPPEDRRGQAAPARAGVLSYVIVGALAVVLLGVVMMVQTGKSIDSKKAELASLDQQQTAADAEAQRLSTFVGFQQIQQQRTMTISSLAQSRFDWDRVLNELTLVMPKRVWLTSIRGTVNPDVTVAGSGVELRSSVAGPALDLTGCGRSHRDVARFISALNDIDGVTRVSVPSSAKSGAPTGTASAAPSEAGGTSSGASSGDCATRPTVASFEAVAAFDEVSVPSADGSVPPTTAAPATSTTTSTSTTTEPAPGVDTSTGDASVADGQQQEQQAKDSTAEQTDRARRAVDLVGGG